MFNTITIRPTVMILLICNRRFSAHNFQNVDLLRAPELHDVEISQIQQSSTGLRRLAPERHWFWPKGLALRTYTCYLKIITVKGKNSGKMRPTTSYIYMKMT